MMSGTRKNVAAVGRIEVTIIRQAGEWSRSLPRYAEHMQAWVAAMQHALKPPPAGGRAGEGGPQVWHHPLLGTPLNPPAGGGGGRGEARALSIVLTDDNAMKTLNHTYRGKNKSTNVLSFTGQGEELGDIVLAYETIKSEARAQQKTFKAHTAHLVVHGCLHLVGYDHENDGDAQQMEAREIAILAKLGFDNPYE